jgi:hypothetical protein
VAGKGEGVNPFNSTVLGRRVLGPAVLAALFWWCLGGTASAHPFGDPQTADITSTATGLQVQWKASPDDVTALAITLGVLDQMRTFVFDDGALVPEESDDADGVKLAEAPEFEAYLLKHLAASVDGVDCTGDLQPVTDVAAEGAIVDFDCGGPVTSADVRITMLTDIHEAYRTMAYGPDDALQAYSVDAESFTWQFREGADQPAGEASPSGPSTAASSAALQLGGIGLAVVVVAGGVVVVRRARRA